MYRHTLDPVMEAVATMADYQFVRSFRCKATMRLPGEARDSSFAIHVDPVGASYSVRETGTDRVWSYESGSSMKVSGGVQEQKFSNQIHDEPLPVRLAFPLLLPIWGRKRDVYRMVTGERHDSRLEISLAGDGSDAPIGGLLTIDRQKRMVVRVDVPTLFLEYDDIEPAQPSEFPRY